MHPLYVVHMPNELQSLITVREAVEITGRDASTISRWIKAGKLKAMKVQPDAIRSPYLIDRDSFDDFMATRKQAS